MEKSKGGREGHEIVSPSFSSTQIRGVNLSFPTANYGTSTTKMYSENLFFEMETFRVVDANALEIHL
uniref:Uncharacterized protein n=1 Tax=Pristionchus pacificus TaxID=54126 RepID=A0A2A6BDG2_PRIPA|eukprot:PDM63881.1 hypothetical protein PRIPAC_53664 [Pristionchus pacificus]